MNRSPKAFPHNPATHSYHTQAYYDGLYVGLRITSGTNTNIRGTSFHAEWEQGFKEGSEALRPAG